jgi:hypothetical protein
MEITIALVRDIALAFAGVVVAGVSAWLSHSYRHRMRFELAEVRLQAYGRRWDQGPVQLHPVSTSAGARCVDSEVKASTTLVRRPAARRAPNRRLLRSLPTRTAVSLLS